MHQYKFIFANYISFQLFDFLQLEKFVFTPLSLWIGAYALVYLRSYGMALVVPWHGRWSRRHGSLPSLSLFDLSSLSFFSLSSFESSLRGSHGLVEIMVWCGRLGWCRGGGLVGGDCVVDGKLGWCCGWLSVMSQMPRPRSNYI